MSGRRALLTTSRPWNKILPGLSSAPPELGDAGHRGGSDGPRIVGLGRTKNRSLRPAGDRTEAPEWITTIRVALLTSDARRAGIAIRGQADGDEHVINVESSVMGDVVRALWDSEVSLQRVRRGSSIHLRQTVSA